MDRPAHGTAQGPADMEHNNVPLGGHHKEDTDSSGETAIGGPADVLFNKVEMAKGHILPYLTPPGEEEADWFYHGLCSSPRLVGRASAGLVSYQTVEEQKEAWRRDPNRSAWFSTKEKILAPIGCHRILAEWESIERLIKLAMTYIPWTSIDVVRLGHIEEPHASRPVVVWVGVKHHDIPWPKVAEALRASKFVLDENKLPDVDVQMRVSQVFPLTSRPPLLPVNSLSQLPSDNVLLPFSTTLGNSISPCAMPTLMGTLGVYISHHVPIGNEGDDRGKPTVWAITCRHVGLPNSLNKDNKCYHPSTGNDTVPFKFFMPSDETASSSIQVLQFLREESAAKSSESDKDSALFSQANDAYEKALAFSARDARVSGSVYFSPPIAAAQSPILWTKDYCLLEMNMAKLPAGEDITNILDIHKELQDLFFKIDLIKAQRTNQPGFSFPDDGRIKIQGLIPLSEIRSPRGPFENHRQDPCIIVMKKGASTGVTFGCPSEILSTVRSCLPDGGEIETREWAIPGSFQNKKVAFSMAGDSGAAIMGLDGRLGGFLTRGVGADHGMSIDITYASPAVLVLEDIEKELGIPVVLL